MSYINFYNGSSPIETRTLDKSNSTANVLGSIDRLRKIYHVRAVDVENITGQVINELRSPQNKSATAEDINDVIKNIVQKSSFLNQKDSSSYFNFSPPARSRIFNVVDTTLSHSKDDGFVSQGGPQTGFSLDLMGDYA